jgi:hypothetical protein
VVRATVNGATPSEVLDGALDRFTRVAMRSVGMDDAARKRDGALLRTLVDVLAAAPNYDVLADLEARGRRHEVLGPMDGAALGLALAHALERAGRRWSDEPWARSLAREVTDR